MHNKKKRHFILVQHFGKLGSKSSGGRGSYHAGRLCVGAGRQAPPPLDADGRVLVPRTLGPLHGEPGPRVAGHGARHGGGAEQAARPTANHRLRNPKKK